MTTGITNQLATLERIAAFSAAVRGHELGEWQPGEDFVLANCIHCGKAVRVYFPAFQPDLDGPALERSCDPQLERAA